MLNEASVEYHEDFRQHSIDPDTRWDTEETDSIEHRDSDYSATTQLLQVDNLEQVGFFDQTIPGHLQYMPKHDAYSTSGVLWRHSQA